MSCYSMCVCFTFYVQRTLPNLIVTTVYIRDRISFDAPLNTECRIWRRAAGLAKHAFREGFWIIKPPDWKPLKAWSVMHFLRFNIWKRLNHVLVFLKRLVICAPAAVHLVCVLQHHVYVFSKLYHHTIFSAIFGIYASVPLLKTKNKTKNFYKDKTVPPTGVGVFRLSNIYKDYHGIRIIILCLTIVA